MLVSKQEINKTNPTSLVVINIYSYMHAYSIYLKGN